MIAHPPCTYLCSSGLHWNTRVPGRDRKTREAMLFVLNLMGVGFVHNPIPRIALENPIGRITLGYRAPDQVIQPWQFGHDASKATCLWFKELPLLRPTKFVDARYSCECGTIFRIGLGSSLCPNCLGEEKFRPIWDNQTKSGQNKLGASPNRAKERAKTYRGIAAAMAAQWGTV